MYVSGQCALLTGSISAPITMDIIFAAMTSYIALPTIRIK